MVFHPGASSCSLVFQLSLRRLRNLRCCGPTFHLPWIFAARFSQLTKSLNQDPVRSLEEEAARLRDQILDLEVQAAKNAACFLVEDLVQAGVVLDEVDGGLAKIVELL